MKKISHRKLPASISRAVFSVALAVFLVGSLLPASPHAEDDRQYKLEAVFLYNFFNYITWPGHQAPLTEATVCVVGDDPLVPYLEYVRQRRANERKLNIRKIGDNGSSAGCQILFDRAGNVGENSNSTLVISGDRSGTDIMIALIPDGDRMGININNSLLTKRGFQVSSRLLKLAEEVR